MSDILISAKNLSVHFPLRGFMFGERPVVRACQGINLDIEKGHFVGLVGESGSGKTTLGRAMLKAAPISEGSVTFTDSDVTYDLASLDRPCRGSRRPAPRRGCCRSRRPRRR